MKSLQHLSRAIAPLAGIAALSYVAPASAAGLSFSERGVRPLARGGAFVAGADDLGAIWYNPAGLADAGTSVLVDMSWLDYSGDFTRRTVVRNDAGDRGVTQSPRVSASTPFLPLPTLAASYAFGPKKSLVAAIGLHVPYTPLTSYASTSAARYSLISLDGSLLLIPGVWLAYKPIPQLRVGAGIEALVGTFKSTVDFSANPKDRLLGAPEDPQYDATTKLSVGPIFAPSANFGVTFVPREEVRIAVSAQLPFVVNAPATVDVKLPSAPEFDSARQDGNKARVRFTLAPVLRAGVEVRPVRDLRVELAYVREFWSVHHSIDIDPRNIRLYGVTGFPSPYRVGAMSIPRHFQDSDSIRLGAEYTFAVKDYVIDARLGVNVEGSGIPANYVSPLTVDSTKVTVGTGAGFHINARWRLDVLYAHIFATDTTVDPETARVPAVNPVKGAPTAFVGINGGTYTAEANVFGLGLNYKL